LNALRAVLLIGILGVLLPSSVWAQTDACPAGIISQLTVERSKPFDGDRTGSGSTFGWAFRAMNALHVTTREGVVRRELFFGVGDCWDTRLIEESERSLAALRFFSHVEAEADLLADGSRHATVRTVDSWSRSAYLTFSIDDGLSITGINATDANLLGTGTTAGVFRRVYRERKRTGVLLRQPNLLGTRIDATLLGGITRTGDFRTQALFRPFAGEIGKTAFRQVAHRRDDYFRYAVDPSVGAGPALLRFRAEAYEASVFWRFGPSEGLRLVAGAGLSREIVRFGDALRVDLVEGGSYGEGVPAPSSVLDAVASQARDHTATRANFTLGLRSIRIERRAGLDGVLAAQDARVGTSLSLTLAPVLPSSGIAGSDVLTRVQGTLALGGPGAYVSGRGDMQARRAPAAAGAEHTWRDVLWDLELDAYVNGMGRTTVFARASYTAGFSMDLPFQLTLGGREGVRAFTEDAFPGARRALVTVEPRIPLSGLGWGLADIGLAAFVDAGRTWGGGVPFGETSEWQIGIGGGLRIGLPAGGLDVLRVDVGRSVSAAGDQGVVFRVYTELLGLLDRRSWPPQVGRSRWYGIDPDLTYRTENPLAGR